MLEKLNEWNWHLGQLLEGHMEPWSVVALSAVFLAGLVTSFTPCVYPMIPVTVSYIGGASEGNRKRAVLLSVIYASGLAVVYASLGVAAAVLGKTFGSFTRTPWIYGGVGLLFLLFGITMMGWITIPVPGFAGRVQTEGTRRGGWIGALLIGAAAGFVAAPCTAPVLASVLVYVARTGDVLWGGTLLLVFAVGLSLLLMMLGIFSGLLSSLPRAGIWMERIKIVFGVGMLAVAVWFLYQAVVMIIYPAGAGP